MDANWNTYPFIEEGDKSIAFRFTGGHVFYHSTIAVEKQQLIKFQLTIN